MTPFIVGLRGPIGVGKTTLAKAIESLAVNRPIYRMSFAGPLREGLAHMGITKERHPDAYRRAAQFVGTDIAREMISEDHWVEEAEDRIASLPDSAIVVFDDVRFHNEIEACDLCLYLKRGGVTVSHADHSSEDLASDPLDDMVIDLDTTSPASVLSLILEHERRR